MNTNTTPPPPPTHDNLARWVSWLVLVAFTALSCHLNAEFARTHGDAVTYHVTLPLLALTSGVYAEIIYLSDVRRPVRWVTGVLVTIGFVIVMIASYISIRGVVYDKYSTFPGWLNDAIAAFPDGFMIIAATVLFAHRWTRVKGAAVNAANVVDEPAAPKVSRWKRLADAATARAEAAMAVPESPQAQPLAEAAEPSVEPSPTAAVKVAEPSVEPSPNITVEVPEPSVEPSPTAVVEVATPSPKPAVKASVKARKPSPKPSVDAALEPYMEAAAQMVDDGVVARKTPVELAAVIAALEDGLSPNGIKTKLGISPSTTEKVRSAWVAERKLVAV